MQGVLGIRWFDCTVTGMEAHAGPTPMALRRDAMQVATHIMQEVVAAALRHKPHAACIVPEKREERTTEGGLDAVGQHNLLAPMVAELRNANPLGVSRLVNGTRSNSAL